MYLNRIGWYAGAPLGETLKASVQWARAWSYFRSLLLAMHELSELNRRLLPSRTVSRGLRVIVRVSRHDTNMSTRSTTMPDIVDGHVEMWTRQKSEDRTLRGFDPPFTFHSYMPTVCAEQSVTDVHDVV